MKGDFQRALRDAERARSDLRLSPAAARRIEERSTGRRRRAPPVRLGLAVAAACAVLAVAYLGYRQVDPARAPPQELARTLPLTGDGRMALEAGVLYADGSTRVEVTAGGPAVLERHPEGLRVVEGEVLFEVAPRIQGEARVVVRVSHGRIEVLGTRFTVRQGGAGGEVILHEGRIAFLTDEGRAVRLAPGEALAWPLAASAPVPEGQVEAEPEVEPAPGPLPGKVASAPPAPGRRPQRPAPQQVEAALPDVEALIEEVAMLRRLGRYREAAGRLEAVLAAELPAATAERLSYELGSILTWQLRDKEGGCAVWSGHRERHGEGRYAAEVARAEASLGCR